MEGPQSGTSYLVGSQTQRDTQSNPGYMKAVLEEEWAEDKENKKPHSFYKTKKQSSKTKTNNTQPLLP